MFDHNIFQDNLVAWTSAKKWCANQPRRLGEGGESRRAASRGPRLRTIADIMKALNPLEGEFYREALEVSSYSREMFCLMEGRHVHPSTLYPGGVGTAATIHSSPTT